LLKLVYLSQNYALLYECNKERADGSCEPSQERLEMLARPHIEIGQAFLRGAGPILQLVCRIPDDMTITNDQGKCSRRPNGSISGYNTGGVGDSRDVVVIINYLLAKSLT